MINAKEIKITATGRSGHLGLMRETMANTKAITTSSINTLMRSYRTPGGKWTEATVFARCFAVATGSIRLRRRLICLYSANMAHDEKTLRRMAALRILPGDLEETFSRSSGPGGQHVNKVSTQVTIRHVPSGLVVTVSESRSQSMNRQLALERLLEVFEKQRAEKRQERQAEISKARRQKAKRSRSTKRKLVEGKRRRGETKKMRGRVSD